MTSERRPPPGWAGDVGLGVQAWVGDTPPTPDRDSSASPPFRASSSRRATKGHGGGRSRTRTPAERDEARARAAAAATAAVEADPEAVGRTVLLNALTGQPRSRRELADKLAAKDVPEEVAAQLLDRFTEVGLIDDAAFAHLWVESRQRSRGLAPRALAQELRRKGIADEESKAALEQIGEDDQRTAARALIDKKLRSLRNVDTATATRRLAGLLARKGYSSGLAFSVVREALGERDEDELPDDD